MNRITTKLPMSSGRLLAVRDYWLYRKGDRQMPTRQELNPANISRHLPSIALTDVFVGLNRS
ncbi:MAG: PAS domain-containing protein [Sneathiella sp.]|nr:PAS domain-containing protein [Sneathiella sp.]